MIGSSISRSEQSGVRSILAPFGPKSVANVSNMLAEADPRMSLPHARVRTHVRGTERDRAGDPGHRLLDPSRAPRTTRGQLASERDRTDREQLCGGPGPALRQDL